MKLQLTVPSLALTYDKRPLRKLLLAAGREIASTAKSLIGRSVHSRPGQPPDSITGALARSLKVKARGDSVSIADTVFYAKFLEVGAQGGGGKKGSRNRRGKPQTRRVLLPRPFLSTAADNEMPSLQKKILASLAAGIERKS